MYHHSVTTNDIKGNRQKLFSVLSFGSLEGFHYLCRTFISNESFSLMKCVLMRQQIPNGDRFGNSKYLRFQSIKDHYHPQMGDENDGSSSLRVKLFEEVQQFSGFLLKLLTVDGNTDGFSQRRKSIAFTNLQFIQIIYSLRSNIYKILNNLIFKNFYNFFLLYVQTIFFLFPLFSYYFDSLVN